MEAFIASASRSARSGAFLSSPISKSCLNGNSSTLVASILTESRRNVANVAKAIRKAKSVDDFRNLSQELLSDLPIKKSHLPRSRPDKNEVASLPSATAKQLDSDASTERPFKKDKMKKPYLERPAGWNQPLFSDPTLVPSAVDAILSAPLLEASSLASSAQPLLGEGAALLPLPAGWADKKTTGRLIPSLFDLSDDQFIIQRIPNSATFTIMEGRSLPSLSATELTRLYQDCADRRDKQTALSMYARILLLWRSGRFSSLKSGGRIAVSSPAASGEESPVFDDKELQAMLSSESETPSRPLQSPPSAHSSFSSSSSSRSMVSVEKRLHAHHFDVDLYYNLIKVLASCGDQSSLNLSFDIVHKHMTAVGVVPNVRVWTALLEACASHARFSNRNSSFASTTASPATLQSIQKAHNAALASGVPLNDKYYSALLRSYCECGRLAEAEKLLNQMLQVSQHGGSLGLESITNRLGSEAVVEEKEESKPKKKQNRKTVKDVLHDAALQASGAPVTRPQSNNNNNTAVLNVSSHETFSVGVAEHTSVMQCCIKAGQPLRAIHFYNRMTDEGLVPSLITYTVLMSAYSDLGDWANAEALMSFARSNYDGSSATTAPLTGMYISYMDVFAKKGDLEKVSTAFNELREICRNGRRVSGTAAVGVMLKAYANAGKVDEALESLDKMLKGASSSSSSSAYEVKSRYLADGFELDGSSYMQLLLRGALPTDRTAYPMPALGPQHSPLSAFPSAQPSSSSPSVVKSISAASTAAYMMQQSKALTIQEILKSCEQLASPRFAVAWKVLKHMISKASIKLARSHMDVVMRSLAILSRADLAEDLMTFMSCHADVECRPGSTTYEHYATSLSNSCTKSLGIPGTIPPAEAILRAERVWTSLFGPLSSYSTAVSSSSSSSSSPNSSSASAVYSLNRKQRRENLRPSSNSSSSSSPSSLPSENLNLSPSLLTSPESLLSIDEIQSPTAQIDASVSSSSSSSFQEPSPGCFSALLDVYIAANATDKARLILEAAHRFGYGTRKLDSSAISLFRRMIQDGPASAGATDLAAHVRRMATRLSRRTADVAQSFAEAASAFALLKDPESALGCFDFSRQSLGLAPLPSSGSSSPASLPLPQSISVSQKQALSECLQHVILSIANTTQRLEELKSLPPRNGPSSLPSPSLIADSIPPIARSSVNPITGELSASAAKRLSQRLSEMAERVQSEASARCIDIVPESGK